MSEQTSYIASLCNKLSQQGKQPSVALIRKLANRPLPLPLVVSVLQKWKVDPEQLPKLSETQEANQPVDRTDHQRILDLETRVSQLESQLTSLLGQIQEEPK
ncbi:hypothetical protein [Aliiglaciecola sp. M165]|uniref:hypothetical protein n=1 Tax=Aliiglaciecola sp. M165 TaxID=2593649 RepID=UPI0011802E95|nr:hypothetical protein [Aliiglaciecola sp. M165]TRY30790.1 hypothetical protein FM019_12965 [Aliiglaciecola sp. M165]